MSACHFIVKETKDILLGVNKHPHFITLSFISPELDLFPCCDDAVDQEVTHKGIQYEDKKVSDMC